VAVVVDVFALVFLADFDFADLVFVAVLDALVFVVGFDALVILAAFVFLVVVANVDARRPVVSAGRLVVAVSPVSATFSPCSSVCVQGTMANDAPVSIHLNAPHLVCIDVKTLVSISPLNSTRVLYSHSVLVVSSTKRDVSVIIVFVVRVTITYPVR